MTTAIPTEHPYISHLVIMDDGTVGLFHDAQVGDALPPVAIENRVREKLAAIKVAIEPTQAFELPDGTKGYLIPIEPVTSVKEYRQLTDNVTQPQTLAALQFAGFINHAQKVEADIALNFDKAMMIGE